jgi:hypothetical protein
MKRSQRKKRKPIPVPVASMGDIAFLLIIFFLVCSEAIKDKSNLPVELPQSEHVATTKVTVAAYPSFAPEDFDGDVRAWLAGRIPWLTDLDADDYMFDNLLEDEKENEKVFKK